MPIINCKRRWTKTEEDKLWLTAGITWIPLAIAKLKRALVKMLDRVLQVHLLDRDRVVFRMCSPKSHACFFWVMTAFRIEGFFYFYLKVACEQAWQIFASCPSCNLEHTFYWILVNVCNELAAEAPASPAMKPHRERKRCSVFPTEMQLVHQPTWWQEENDDVWNNQDFF